MSRTRIVMSLLLAAGAALSPALAQQYVISTYAGGGAPPTPTPAVDAWTGAGPGAAADTAGNVYFSSSQFNAIFKLDPSGVLTRVAGNASPGYSGDGGPATSAQLNDPRGVAVDGAGNLFIADYNNSRIRRVSPDGIIATVAGNGGCCFSGDDGPATAAQLSSPDGVAVDRAGNLFIVGGDRIRKVSPAGIITTVVGDGTRGFSGDGSPATSAQLNGAVAVAVDGAGSLFVGELSRIRKVSPEGIISTVAGTGGPCCYSGDGGPATAARLAYPRGLAVDEAGNLFIADPYNGRIRRVSPDGIITTVAGGGQDVPGDGGPATSAQLGGPPGGVAVDRAGNLFIVGGNRVRKVSPNGIISTVAGGGPCCSWGDGGPATSAALQLPHGVAADRAGNLFIADSANHRIRKVSSSGVIVTAAGDGTPGFSGDGGPSTGAQLNWPSGLAVDRAGNLFIADAGNRRIRKVSSSGVITTVVGSGATGFSGDGGPATSAALSPATVTVDGAGNLFIADSINHRVRKVSPNGIITTVAGDGTESYSGAGDGGPATSASLGSPSAVAVDDGGNLFIATSIDPNYEVSSESRIRRVAASGVITTVAGGEPGTDAYLGWVPGLALDSASNLLIAGNRGLRRLFRTGTLTTVAQLSWTQGVAVDGAGNVYVTEYGTGLVRVLRPTDRSVLISTVVDAASQREAPVSPGKIVVIYGSGFGPGATVSFNGIAATVLYSSATQVNAVAPNTLTGTTAQVTVTYQGQVSDAVTVPVAPSAPNLFTLNQTGAGQAAAINAVDGTVNTAANPVRIGGFISLYATGEGQTGLPVRVTVGGIPATVQYAGAAPGQVAGLMQVNAQIPGGVQPGGYVPVVLQVGDRTSGPAVWIAVSGS